MSIASQRQAEKKKKELQELIPTTHKELERKIRQDNSKIKHAFMQYAKELKTLNMLAMHLNTTDVLLLSYLKSNPIIQELYYSTLKGAYEQALIDGDLLEQLKSPQLVLRLLDNLTDLKPIEKTEGNTTIFVESDMTANDFAKK